MSSGKENRHSSFASRRGGACVVIIVLGIGLDCLRGWGGKHFAYVKPVLPDGRVGLCPVRFLKTYIPLRGGRSQELSSIELRRSFGPQSIGYSS